MATALDRAVEVKDIIAALKRFGLTHRDLASATGVSERSVHNWTKTSATRPRYEQRLGDLRDIVLILQDSLSPRGVGQWLRARNRLLGGRRPIDLVVSDQADAVRRAAESFIDGAYV